MPNLGHQKLQELSEEEDDFQSGYFGEEIGDEEEREGYHHDAKYSHHRNQPHRSHKKRSFETNEDEDGQSGWDEDEIGSNEEMG